MFGDGVAMGGPSQQCAEDENVERALQEFHARGRFVAHCIDILLHMV